MGQLLISRRTWLHAWLAIPASAALPRALDEAEAQDTLLDLTPQCGEADDLTQAQTEGPFFTPETPLKRDFRVEDEPGEPIALHGFVVDRSCKPIRGALIELWHADAAGKYDNRGFRYRGHQFSDDAGRYVFETIVPGLYPGRTRHFHVKVQPAGRRMLTTQLYFPDEPGNRRDRIFDESLLLTLNDAADGRLGRFDFVVAG